MDALLGTHREAILRLAEARGRARGEAGPHSDVDLLVDVPREYSLLKLINLEYALEDLLGCEVDLVAEDEVPPRIRSRVIAEAFAL